MPKWNEWYEGQMNQNLRIFIIESGDRSLISGRSMITERNETKEVKDSLNICKNLQIAEIDEDTKMFGESVNMNMKGKVWN